MSRRLTGAIGLRVGSLRIFRKRPKGRIPHPRERLGQDLQDPAFHLETLPNTSGLVVAPKNSCATVDA